MLSLYIIEEEQSIFTREPFPKLMRESGVLVVPVQCVRIATVKRKVPPDAVIIKGNAKCPYN